MSLYGFFSLYSCCCLIFSEKCIHLYLISKSIFSTVTRIDFKLPRATVRSLIFNLTMMAEIMEYWWWLWWWRWNWYWLGGIQSWEKCIYLSSLTRSTPTEVGGAAILLLITGAKFLRISLMALAPVCTWLQCDRVLVSFNTVNRELKYQTFLLSRRPTGTKLWYLNTSCGRVNHHGGLQAAFCLRVGLPELQSFFYQRNGFKHRTNRQ